MKIVQVSRNRIPPKGYGGTERLIYWLSVELKRLGHSIIIVGNENSSENESLGFEFIKWTGADKDLPAVLNSIEDFDIVHYHAQFDAKYIINKPYLVTQHGNHRSSSKMLPNTVFISQSHANNHNSNIFVYNGIPINEYPFNKTKNHNMLFMALVEWKAKNVSTAIDLALDTNTTIDICGGDPFKVKGAWQKRSLKYQDFTMNIHGQVDGAIKLQHLSDSSLLFYAVNWQEPFALAPHEALACGTPVLVSPNGALSEYIEHGVNGYIVSSYNEAKASILHHKNLSKEDLEIMSDNCRKSAFSIEDCAKNYLNMYEKVLADDFLYTEAEHAKLKYVRKRNIKISRNTLVESLKKSFK